METTGLEKLHTQIRMIAAACERLKRMDLVLMVNMALVQCEEEIRNARSELPKRNGRH